MILNRRSEKRFHKNSQHALASVSPTEIHELIAALQSQFEKVQANTAFLALKESEFRPDSYFSMSGLMETREQLHFERSLLAGHAFMIQEMLAAKEVKLDANSSRILRRILDYASKATVCG